MRQMKKLRQIMNNSILLCCMLQITQGVFAQTVEKWYVNMPDGLNPTLSKQNRLELLEYYKAGQGDSVTNRYGNQARLLAYDSISQSIVVKNTIIAKNNSMEFISEIDRKLILPFMNDKPFVYQLKGRTWVR